MDSFFNFLIDNPQFFIIFSIIGFSLLIGMLIYGNASNKAGDTYIVQYDQLKTIFNKIDQDVYMTPDELNNLKVKANFITNQICNNYFNQLVEFRIKQTTDLNNKIQNM